MKPYYENAGITIFHGDCREILPSLPKADLVLTDPPYGIFASNPKRGGFQHGNAAAPSRIYESSDWDSKRIEWIKDVLTAPSQIVWGGNYYADLLSAEPGWLFWDKDNGSNGYADGELAWTNLGMALRKFKFRWMGMIQQNMAEKEVRFHPTQKPTPLMEWCLNLVPDAEVILDPFIGSGTTLRAAKDLGRKAIGIEIEERYCEIAARRLQQEVLGL